MEKSHEMSAIMMDYYKKAQENHEIRQDLNLALIPILTDHIRQLAADPQLMKMYNSPIEIVREVTTFFFYGIVPHPKHP
jgi:hypothetical protein